MLPGSRVLCPQILRSYAPRALCSQVRRSYVPWTLCSQVLGSNIPRFLGPTFKVLGSYVPRALCSKGPVFPNSRVLYSLDPMFPGPMFPSLTLWIMRPWQRFLCSQDSTFPSSTVASYVPTALSMFPWLGLGGLSVRLEKTQRQRCHFRDHTQNENHKHLQKTGVNVYQHKPERGQGLGPQGCLNAGTLPLQLHWESET